MNTDKHRYFHPSPSRSGAACIDWIQDFKSRYGGFAQ
jgi:hypothetical protein